MAKNCVGGKFIIYGVGFLTITESVILLTLFGSVHNNASSVRAATDLLSVPPPDDYNRALTITTLALTVYCIRLVCGFFLVIGQISKSLIIILIILISMVIGIAANTAVGIMGFGSSLTRVYSHVAFWLIGLHAIYIFMIWHVLKVEFKNRVTAAAFQGPAGHVPYCSPVQTTVSVGSHPLCEVSSNNNSVATVQVDDNPRIKNESTGNPYPPPAKYSEVDQSAEYVTKQKSEKPVN